MSLLVKGALYSSREAIQNPAISLRELARHALLALDDVASQIQAIRSQGNYGQKIAPQPPHPLSSIAVVNSGGFAQVTLTHNSPPAGSRYVIEYSTTPNFTPATTQRSDNGISLSWERYLHGKTLYFRSAVMYSSSKLGPWVYYGTATSPTSVAF